MQPAGCIAHSQHTDVRRAADAEESHKENIFVLESEQKPENKTLIMPGFSDDTDLEDDDQIERPRSGRRAWIIGLCVVALIIVLVPTIFFALRGLRTQRVTYLSRPVATGNLSLVVSATGPVQGTIYAAD